MSLTLHIVLFIVLAFSSAFFSAAETAIFSLSKIERRRLKESHPKLGRWVFYHLDRPSQTLSTILIANLTVNIFLTALMTRFSMTLFGPGATGVVLTLFTILFIIFCEVAPKTLAVRKNYPVALISGLPLRIVSIFLFPLRKLLRAAADKMLSYLVKEKREVGDQISSEELKALVKIGEEEGVLDRQERYMIQKTMELGERLAKDIMTPRVQVRGLDIEDSFEHHVALMKEFHHTHFLIYKQSIDNVLGFVSVQEYMLDEKHHLPPLLKQPLFIPQTKRIDDLLFEFRAKKNTLGVCVDEYGGTAGLVTVEDILEEIFGEFYDEYATVENPVRPFGTHEYLVEGKISLADFNERFSLHLEAAESSTLNGFILEKLGEVPDIGRVIDLPECQIKIHEVLRQRYIRSLVVRLKS